MIDRQYGKVTFECDSCGELLETDESDWTDAQAHFRSAGWLAQKVGQEWLHTCDTCKDDR